MPALDAARRWLPDTLRGRLTLLLVLAVLASHVLALSLMIELRPRPPRPPAISAMAPPPGPPPHAGVGPAPQGLMGILRAPVPIRWGLALDIAVRMGALVVAAWWAARWLTRPVQRLADAAQALGREEATHPVPEEGPREFRQASRVFNQMQARIRQQLAERDRFVAAVSHDLRTPLTRLRLRTEGLTQAAERERMGRDIAEMDAMITATLEHLRGAAHAEPLATVDVRALIDSMADDYLDSAGRHIGVHGGCAPLRVRPGALRRCLDNLVGNALRYGGSAQVTVQERDGAVRICVRDHGPGLAAHDLANAMEPFYRAEPSRNRASAGVGLGLSIARDIALRHGGTLALSNAAGGGLLATLELPRTPGGA